MTNDTVLASWPEDAFPLCNVQGFVAAYFGQREASAATPIQVYAAYTTPPDQRLTARFVVQDNEGRRHEAVYRENRLPLCAASARAHALVSEVSSSGTVPRILAWQDGGKEGTSRLLYEPFEGRPVEESGLPALIETARTLARIQNAVAASGQAEGAGLPRVEVKDTLTAFDSVYGHISKCIRAWEADEGGNLSKWLVFPASEVLDVLSAIRPQVARCAEAVASLGLPGTINHNDLHAGNAIVRPDGTILIYDWEMATFGCPLFSLDKLLVSAWRQDQGLRPGGPWGYVPGTPTQALLRDAYLQELGRSDIDHETFAAAMALACVQEMKTEIDWAVLTGWPDGNPEWTAQLIRRMQRHLWLEGESPCRNATTRHEQMEQASLHEAARVGDLSSVMLLVQQGADPNEIGPHDWPLLIHAAHSENPEVVRWLLDNGADIEATDRDGKNVLHHAAMRGRAAVVRLLLKRGCDPNIRDSFGEFVPLRLTAAHASRTTDMATAAALLDAGASIEARDKWGVTPLMGAAQASREELVCYLLERGADIEARTNEGTTALMLVADQRFHHEQIAPILLQRGAHIDAQDDTGRTALMRAAGEMSGKIVPLLLEHGASRNLQDRHGRTALHYAAGVETTAGLIGLLRREPELNGACRNSKKRGLAEPIEGEWQERAGIVRLLLENGTDLSLRDDEGKTALDWARQQVGGDAVVKALMTWDS